MNCHWQLCGLGCTCNCCGIAATSVAPVKRYNDLVPDVFPKSQPPLDAPVDAATARKLKKLVEYVDKNPQRGPKVSRRLARRLGEELSRQRHSYVLLAAEAYSSLLAGLKPSDTRLLARELIVQRVTRGGKMDVSSAINARSSVVGLLSRHSRPDMRAAAARLFRQFVELQDSGDYLPQLAALAPAFCSAATGQVPGATKPAAGGTGAAGSDEDICAAEALRALDAYDSLVTRLSLPDNLFPSVAGVLVEVYSRRSAAAVGNQAAGAEPQKQSLSAAAAAQLAAGIGSRTQAADGTSERLATLLGKAAEAGRWRDGRGPALLADLCRGVEQPHQAWPVYEALLKHTTTLPAAEHKVVLDLAVDLAAAQLQDSFATASLALLLRSTVRNGATNGTTEAVSQAVRRLAQQCGQLRAVSALTSLLLGGWDAAPSPSAAAAIAEAAQANGPLGREAVAPLLSEAQAVLATAAPTLEQQQDGHDTLEQRQHRQHTAHLMLQALQLGYRLGEADATPLLSAIWHQAASPDSTPAQFPALAATLGWLVRDSDEGGLAAAASFAGSLWTAAVAPTGALVPASPGRRTALMVLHCSAAISLSNSAGSLSVTDTAGAGLQRAAETLQPASHLRLQGSTLLVTDPGDWTAGNDETAAELLSAASSGPPGTAALSGHPRLAAAMQQPFPLVPSATLCSQSQSWAMAAEAAQQGNARSSAAAAPVGALNGPTGAASAPAGAASPVPPATTSSSDGTDGTSGGSSVGAAAVIASAKPEPAVAAGGAAAAAPPAPGLSDETQHGRHQTPGQGPAPEQAPVAARNVAANSSAEVPRPAGESTDAADAIAALDRLLAAHGVPPMRPQPPPGLISTAA